MCIRDSGISAETLARIGQQRVAGAAPSHGLENPVGLGLTIAHHLVQLHNGELRIESEPGHGTTCYLLLPHKSAAPMAMELSPHQPAHTPQRRDLQTQHFAEQIRQFVAEHYTTALTREQVAAALGVTPVSYTHLDVYKRQGVLRDPCCVIRVA